MAPRAGKQELALSAAEPASRPGCMDEAACLASEKSWKLRQEKTGVRFHALPESTAPSCDGQEAISFCSKPQDKTNGPSSLLRTGHGAAKRRHRSEHQDVAIRVLRPSYAAWTLGRHAAESGCAQWGQGTPPKKRAARMDPERIRNVMSEVIGLWPRAESLGGCKVRNLLLKCNINKLIY